ncbi:MAG: LptA/OstA family protein [Armatimonadota bacterium]
MRKLMTVLILACLTLAAAFAQEADEPGGLAEDEDRARIEQADHLRYDPAEAIYYLEGNVVFSHKDIKLYCDEAVYDYDDNSAVATGNPKVVEPETTITGDAIEADFDAEVATIAGNVTAITQKKRAAGEEPPQEDEGDEEPPRTFDELHEKKTTITCQKIVHEYGEDREVTTATDRIRAVQEDKTVYADRAVHEQKKDLITLTGDVRVLTDRGDELRSPRVVISTEEDWIRAENVQVVGKRRPENEDSDDDDEAPPSPPAEEQQPAEDDAAEEQPPPDTDADEG